MASKTKIRGITIELNGDTTGLSKSISGINSKLKDTQDQLKDVEKLLKLDPHNTELLAQKQRLLGDAVNQTKEKLELLKKARDQANDALAKGDENAQKQLDALQREIVQTEHDLDDLTDQAQKFDKKGGEHFKSAGEKLKTAMKTAAKVAAAAFAAVATAAVQMTRKLISAVNEVSEYGDEVDKNSKKIGFSAAAYQEWAAVLEHTGTSFDAVSKGMKTLAKKAQSGSDAFRKLGISQQEAASMSREQLWARTITALQNVEDEEERARLATELFGNSASELGPLLATSAQETAAMRKRVRDLGGVMSDEAVAASAAYQDSPQDLQTALEGLKRRLVSGFMPALTKMMDGLTALFTGDKKGMKSLSQGIEEFADKLTEAIPSFVEIATEVILQVGEAVTRNLPKLVDSAVKGIIMLLKGIIAQTPTVLKMLVTAIIELIKSIGEELPTLVPAIVDMVLEIVDYLTQPDTAEMLTEAVIKLVLALVEGLIRALPRIIAAIPGIIMNIIQSVLRTAPQFLEAGEELLGNLGEGLASAADSVLKSLDSFFENIWEGFKSLIDSAASWGKALLAKYKDGIIQGVRTVLDTIKTIGTRIWEGFKSLIDSAVNWGRDLLRNFLNGLKSGWEKVKGWFTGALDWIRGVLHFSEPDFGPLSDFHNWAPDMMKLFAQGIRDNTGLVKDAALSAFDFMPDVAASAGGREFTVPRDGGSAAAAGGGNVTVILEMDRMQLARAVYKMNNEETQRVGVVLDRI